MQRILSAVLAATVAAGALATPMLASAQPYGYQQDGRYDGERNPCQQRKHNGSTGGAIIGALAGAALGSNIGGHGARTEGTIIGGVAGAVVGGNVGRASAGNSDACREQGYYDQRNEYRTYGQSYYYRDGFYDQRGQWRTYDRRHDRGYYQRRYGEGYGYDSYNYGRR
jgi:hypothetical protein